MEKYVYEIKFCFLSKLLPNKFPKQIILKLVSWLLWICKLWVASHLHFYPNFLGKKSVSLPTKTQKCLSLVYTPYRNAYMQY